jgi:predicted amidohydrolase YtcJ
MGQVGRVVDGDTMLAIGSDGPNNPYLNIMLASTYPANPGQAVTREQAVTAYTLTSAYAELAEKDKGSLEPGKLADLAVLSQDIFRVRNEDLLKRRRKQRSSARRHTAMNTVLPSRSARRRRAR